MALFLFLQELCSNSTPETGFSLGKLTVFFEEMSNAESSERDAIEVCTKEQNGLLRVTTVTPLSTSSSHLKLHFHNQRPAMDCNVF